MVVFVADFPIDGTIIANKSETGWISLMYKRKRVGPITEPWGTPDVTSLHDDRDPSTTTACFLLQRSDIIHAWESPMTPVLQFTAQAWWGTCQRPSGSLGKQYDFFEGLMTRRVPLIKLGSSWERKPCWSSVRMLFTARCFDRWQHNMFHYFTAYAGKWDWPILRGHCKPDLWMGATSACLHWVGTTPQL